MFFFLQTESKSFLTELLMTPSPSGFEQPVQRLIRKRMTHYADEITSDVHGNTVVAINPKGTPRVMLAGHVDQIGFMVNFISKEGFVYFKPIGGVDVNLIPGLVLTVHSSKGSVDGVVGRKAIHMMKAEEKKSLTIERKDMWLDIGAKDKKEALELVEIGDAITYKLSTQRLGKGTIAAPAIDDKTGVFSVMEAVKLMVLSKRKITCAVFAVSTVQEEIGVRGAKTSCFGLDPQVGIAVDVTFASDFPGADKKTMGEMALGKGPALHVGPNINPTLFNLLVRAARKKKIPFQRAATPNATGTDANVIQISRSGVAAALVSIPTRYVHTPVEVAHFEDLENTARLLAETCVHINKKVDFVPR